MVHSKKWSRCLLNAWLWQFFTPSCGRKIIFGSVVGSDSLVSAFSGRGGLPGNQRGLSILSQPRRRNVYVSTTWHTQKLSWLSLEAKEFITRQDSWKIPFCVTAGQENENRKCLWQTDFPAETFHYLFFSWSFCRKISFSQEFGSLRGKSGFISEGVCLLAVLKTRRAPVNFLQV